MASDEQGEGAAGARTYWWTFGNAEFDEARWQLRVAGQNVELEHKPLEVLQYLLRHAGEAVTKDELLASVWAGRVVVDAVLTNAVGKLRRALDDEAQDVIVTLPRVGYRLAAPVSRKRVDFIPAAGRLEAGDAVPRRPNWRLEEALARTDGNEVWLARHAKTRETRVFKFSLAGKGLGGLKREVTVARLLREALGEREDFVRVLDWDFEQAPYFVESEYGGVSLDRWPASGGIAAISRERRLALFVQAAEAVGIAHGVGVLHKDLKPANLLVHGEGDEARMRVADFGSSRLFESGVLDGLGITQLGLTHTHAISDDSGTPLYLAPEVVAGQTATIKSDVYALGVTLYQLLVGDFRRPLAPGWESDIDDPLLQQDIADAADGDPKKRLESAAALAERIRNLSSRREKRALEQAVQARIAEGEKRLAKVRARRPWMIAAFIVLASALCVSLVQFRQTSNALKAAEEARRSLRMSLDAQDRLNKFLINDVIAKSNPDRNNGKVLTVLEALEKARGDVAARFQGQPGPEGEVRLALGKGFDAISRIPDAKEQIEKARVLLDRAYGRNDSRTMDADLAFANLLVFSNDLKAAEKIVVDAGNRLEAPNIQWAPDLIQKHARVAWNLAYVKHDARAAIAQGEKFDRLVAKNPASLPMDIVRARMSLATSYALGADYVRAEKILTEVVSLAAANGLLKQAEGIDARVYLVQMLMQTGKTDQALELLVPLERDMLERTGPDSPTLSNVYMLRAVAYTQARQFDNAAEQYRTMRELLSRTVGPSSTYTLFAVQSEAQALRWGGRSRDALRNLEAHFLRAKETFGEESIPFSEFAIVMVMTHLDLGDEAAARKLLDATGTVDGRIPDDARDGRLGTIRLMEARLARANGDITKSQKLLDEAIQQFPDGSDYWFEATNHRKEWVAKRQ